MMVFLIGIQYLKFKGLRHDLFFSSKNEISLIYILFGFLVLLHFSNCLLAMFGMSDVVSPSSFK